MFLVPTLPHDPSRLSTYCQALLAAFDADDFTRFYAEARGKLLEHEVDTSGGFKDVLFRLLIKSQHDGTLRELLVAALCYRAANGALVDMLDDTLAIQPIVELAAFLADHQYQPRHGQEVVDAIYAERLVRKRPWMHREGRAAWLEALIVCDNLPAADEPIPPLIIGLNAIDEAWRPRGGTTTLRERIDRICARYGIPSAAPPSTLRASESFPAMPKASSEKTSAHSERDHEAQSRLLSTLKSGWRAATTDGQGAYQIGMMCFGLAAFFFHGSVWPQKLEPADLSSPQEPSEPARYPALCYPVTASSNAAPNPIGVVCIDIAVPFKIILSKLQQASNTLELSLLKVSSEHDIQSCDGFRTSTAVSGTRSGSESARDDVPIDEQPCSLELAHHDEKIRDLAAAYYRDHLKAPKLDPAGLGGLALIQDGYYGVVVAAPNPGEGPWYVAIARLRPSTPRSYSSMALCALALLAGVCVLVMSFRRKLKRQQALLARGLHYGLLEIENGKIIGGNDRAEEILLTDLPRLGIHTCNQLGHKTLSGMLDEERCVLVPASGRLRESDIRTYDSTIKDRTSDGLTSTFYAWVKLRKDWIKVISTVILLPDHGERVLCTLDPHIDEAHRLFLANLRQGDR